MIRKYEVKIDDSILPKVYTFEQLISEGILDDVDENIKVRQCGASEWVTARKYPFADLENNEHHANPLQNDGVRATAPHRHYTQNTMPYQAKYPNVTHQWNWGAFSFSWFWGILNGLYWPLIIIAFNFIPYVGVFISLCISIFLGFKGNKFAWRIAQQKGTSISSFIKTQSKWNRAGISLFVLEIFVAIFYITLALL